MNKDISIGISTAIGAKIVTKARAAVTLATNKK